MTPAIAYTDLGNWEGTRMAKKSVLAERLDEVRGKIAGACARAKRDPKEVTLIAVTKTAGPSAAS